MKFTLFSRISDEVKIYILFYPSVDIIELICVIKLAMNLSCRILFKVETNNQFFQKKRPSIKIYL